ncbi:DUF2254 family protein [Rossellomorea vietnamensis]|uniref:DUF2254 family protein n=1 Tax=Rossellomorea vietnamensis TaxID=218284 RepID=UPI00068F683E|nr:DUF2254 family protein [Rossellomorea vietnamensis]
MNLNIHILNKAQKSFWFVPFLFSLISLLLSLVTFYFDWWLSQHNYPIFPKVLFSNFNLSMTIISTIASSIMTMTTITFSTIMVVLTTFLSQYSPRTLQNFINDRPTQRVLAIFVSGVVYCITLLVLLQDESGQELYISSAFAGIVAVICLFVFVYFVHHVSNWVKVSNLIHNITIKTNKKLITATFTEEMPFKRNLLHSMTLSLKKRSRPMCSVKHPDICNRLISKG